MVRGGFDRSRSSSSLGSSQPPTRATKLSRVPSGDQVGLETPCRWSVSRTASPPSAGTTYSWPWSPFPLGHEGEPSPVRRPARRGVPPRAPRERPSLAAVRVHHPDGGEILVPRLGQRGDDEGDAAPVRRDLRIADKPDAQEILGHHRAASRLGHRPLLGPARRRARRPTAVYHGAGRFRARVDSGGPPASPPWGDGDRARGGGAAAQRVGLTRPRSTRRLRRPASGPCTRSTGRSRAC